MLHSLTGPAGRCKKCKRPARSGILCQRCHNLSMDKKKNRALKLSAAGCCCTCGRSLEKSNSLDGYSIYTNEFLQCSVCFFKKAAKHNAGKTSLWRDIRDLFEKQQRKCAYTGADLVLCYNATLDHKVPRSRGGDNSVSNLQWVAKHVNLAKHDMTHDEFLDLCRRVVEGPNAPDDDRSTPGQQCPS